MIKDGMSEAVHCRLQLHACMHCMARFAALGSSVAPPVQYHHIHGLVHHASTVARPIHPWSMHGARMNSGPIATQRASEAEGRAME